MDFCTKFSIIRRVFPPALSENNFWQSGSFCPPSFQEGKGRTGGISEKKFKLVPNTLKTSLEKHPKKGKRMGLEKGGNF